MKGDKIFDFSRKGFQDIINIMTNKINECVDVANGMIPRLDDYVSKIDWDKIVNDELYQNVLGEVGKTKEQLETIARKEIQIDLFNPPKETGLLPLTDNSIENSIRLQNIFNYIKENEVSYQPNNRQYTGYSYKVKFPTGTILLENTVEIKGSYIILDGDRTIIKCNNGSAFKVRGTTFRKALVKGLTFDSCNAFDIDKDNIDCGMVTFDNCWFITTPGDAIKIIDQSTHYTFSKCHFYQCKYIANIINVDHTTFRDCWFSEYPREANGEASLILKGTFTNIENCMIIPSGYDRNGTVTNEANLTDIAWINAYGSVVIDGCRVSAEPNNKTLINCFASAKLDSPFEPKVIEVKNCYRLCCTKGKSIINLFAIPNKINITNNSFGIANERAIKYSEQYNVNDDPALSLSGEELNKVEIKIENNIGQNSQVADIPFELKKFLKINEVQTGLIYKDGTLYSKRKGETVNQSVKVETNYQYNEVKICNSVYMIKMTWQTDTTFVNSRSIYVGLLSFVSKKSSEGNIVEAVLTPIVSLQGGSYTSQQNPININVLFGKTSTSKYIPTSGDTQKINIYISVASEIEGEAKFAIQEVTDGQFLM